jgi:metal-sulfur cluster biosynthetic enzyme
MMVSQDQVTEALKNVVDPCSIATGVPINLVDMGIVRGISIDKAHVEVQLRFTSPVCLQAMNITSAIEDAVMAIDGVEQVTCDTRSGAWEWKPEMMAPSAQARLRRLRPMPEVRVAGKSADRPNAGVGNESALAAGSGGTASP